MGVSFVGKEAGGITASQSPVPPGQKIDTWTVPRHPILRKFDGDDRMQVLSVYILFVPHSIFGLVKAHLDISLQSSWDP